MVGPSTSAFSAVAMETQINSIIPVYKPSINVKNRLPLKDEY